MDSKITVRLGGVVWNQDTETAMVILEDDKCQGYALPVTPFEASAVILEMQGTISNEPCGYRSIISLLKQIKATPVELRIYAASSIGVFINLHYRRGLKSFNLEVSTGDALCLSQSLRCPITIMNSLWKALIAPKAVVAKGCLDTELLFIKPRTAPLQSYAG